MNHKVGDRVRIRSQEWLCAQGDDEGGYIIPKNGGIYIDLLMFKHAGEEAVILDIEREEYLLDIDEKYWFWEDWMFDPGYSPADEPLSAEDAIRAMLDGETLYDNEGCFCIWNKADEDFQFWHEDGLTYKKCTEYSGLCRRPEKRKRDMTGDEAKAWAESDESLGWMVKFDVCWKFPRSFSFSSPIELYQRARIKTDLSGIDESTICGFEVEE